MSKFSSKLKANNDGTCLGWHYLPMTERWRTSMLCNGYQSVITIHSLLFSIGFSLISFLPFLKTIYYTEYDWYLTTVDCDTHNIDPVAKRSLDLAFVSVNSLSMSVYFSPRYDMRWEQHHHETSLWSRVKVNPRDSVVWWSCNHIFTSGPK